MNNIWDKNISRVLIYTANYLEFDGSYSAGGRQRHIRDLANVIKNIWGRDVLIVQKGVRDFRKHCDYGFEVIGIKSNLTAKGDILFSHKFRTLVKTRDGVIYASGEDAWPFFVENSKAIQHGVWWDGPQSKFTQLIQKKRVLDCMSSVRSMLCVDTNFINWLRCQGSLGLSLAKKCNYVPNYADLEKLSISIERKSGPMRLICARRYEEKRGIDLFVDALKILNNMGIDYVAHISTVGGIFQVKKRLTDYKLLDKVSVSEDNMDVVLTRYVDADIAVVPTIWSEGTSLACVEAICAGLPVVTTPVGGLGNLVIPGFNGYVVAPDPELLAQAIAKFNNTNIILEMKSNCLSMREAFGKKQWEQRLLEWLKS